MTTETPPKNYYVPEGDVYYEEATGNRASEADNAEMKAFWDFIGSDAFVCTGGKSAHNRDAYRCGLHAAQGTDEAAKSLAAHLYRFQAERASGKLPFLYCVYAAFFDGPEITSEVEAHNLVWQQLQKLHEVDMQYHDYPKDISNDVTSSQFSFAVGGQLYMVPSLNPFSSRLTRKYKRQVMVFIPREEFHYIYDNGIYQKMQKKIRAHDIRLQGSYNPMLDLHDAGSSDAVTFSGMHVKSAAECPFKAFIKKAKIIK